MSDSRTTVVAPGRNCPLVGALLMYTAQAVQRRGSSVHEIPWRIPDDEHPHGRWTEEQVAQGLDRTTGATSMLLVGKSLGPCAAPLITRRGLPAIWFTPLLNQSHVVTGLRTATLAFLLIGETADRTWDPDLARDLTPHICEISGADHALFIANAPLSASAQALASVTDAVENSSTASSGLLKALSGWVSLTA